MCGLAWIKMLNGQNANRNAKAIYFNQKSRGKEGFGFLSIVNDKVVHCRAKFEHEILHDLKINPSKEIYIHHRKPTSTENTINTAHPLCTNDNFKDHKYYLMHNGRIHNANELYSKHTDLKLKYSSVVGVGKFDTPIFNDSECLLFELALVLEGIKKPEEFEAYGGMAFIIIQTDKNDKPLNMYYGKNYSSDLKMKVDEDKIIIASEIDGEHDIASNKLNSLCYADNKTSSIAMDFPYSKPTSKIEVNKMLESGGHVGEIAGSRWLEKENPLTRAKMMFNGFRNEELYKGGRLSKKKEDELYKLSNGLDGDLQVTISSLMGEHDPAERARLKEEEDKIRVAMKEVQDEINSRIVTKAIKENRNKSIC